MPDFPVSESFAATANGAQLHDEARGNLVKWPASFTYVGGQLVYRVDREDIDSAKVVAAIQAHTPDPEYGLSADSVTLRGMAAKATLTAAEVGQAVRLLLKRMV